jgi:hypothetical protein
MNCSITLKVEQIVESTAAIDIPQGKYVLSLPEKPMTGGSTASTI